MSSLSVKIIDEMAIATDVANAALISSVRGIWGHYFAVLEAPRTKRPDLQHEIARRANLFIQCGFSQLWPVGLTKDELRALNSAFSPSQTKSVSQGEIELLGNKKIAVIPFKREDAAEALFNALRSNSRLELSPNAPSVQIDNAFPTECLVISEKSDEIGSIVAANLACLLQAHFIVINKGGKKSADEVDSLIRKYEEEQDSSIKEALETALFEKMNMGISADELERYSYCVIFTSGIPYGATVKRVPSGHFFLYPDCGLQVLKSVMSTPIARSALVVDSGHLPKSETDEIRNELEKKGVFVQVKIGKEATISEVSFCIRELPYDYIFFVAHGGFPKGRRLSVQFNDSANRSHIFVMRTLDTFSMVRGTDKVSIMTFMEPESMDGVLWADSDGADRKEAHDIMSHWDEAIKTGRAKIVGVEKGIEMRWANCISLSDDVLFPFCDKFGSIYGPVILNNICSSFSQMAGNFMFGGATAYIGTLFSVLDSVAAEFAKGFVSSQETFGSYVKQFNERYFASKRISCYVLVGLPTYAMSHDVKDNKKYFRSAVEGARISLLEYREQNPFHHMGEQIDWTLTRMNQELRNIS